VSFTFRCALIFVDTYAHTLFLEVNSIFHVPYVLILTTPLRLAPCFHLQIKGKQIMWARIITLQRTIHTLTPTMQGGEPTPIFHGVTLKMCKIPKGSKEISNREITIKLHRKRSNLI
jgi:hypothetical protein